MTEWLGQPIPLEIDHIDGDSTNNSLDNFRILCPNCHAQTPTYRGLNIKNPLVKNMKQTRYQKYQKTSKV
jgi:5-methylcytosine-specific restriction endonuclease McrA